VGVTFLSQANINRPWEPPSGLTDQWPTLLVFVILYKILLWWNNSFGNPFYTYWCKPILVQDTLRFYKMGYQEPLHWPETGLLFRLVRINIYIFTHFRKLPIIYSVKMLWQGFRFTIWKNVMKRIFRNVMAILLIAASSSFILSGCYESRYNQRYHHHTREWYGRHHQPPPAGINFEIDLRR